MTAVCPPILKIVVEEAEAVEFAAVPTLRFGLRIESTGPPDIRSVALHTQVRIAPARRSYDVRGQERLAELFGAPEGWSRSLRSLLWTQVATQVPAFTGGTVADLPVTCTYDFEVAAAKYLHVVADGEIPLEFLFSGTIFYLVDGRLQAAQIPWDTDAEFRMPVRVWKDVMERYFPRGAWLRLDREVFDRLYGYKVRHTLATWDDVLGALLPADECAIGGE